jgi:hypothetical protein
LLKLFDLLHALLFVGCDFELVFVAPKHCGLRLYSSLLEHHVQVYDLIETAIPNNQEERPVICLNAVFNQDFDSFVYFLFH